MEEERKSGVGKKAKTNKTMNTHLIKENKYVLPFSPLSAYQ